MNEQYLTRIFTATEIVAVYPCCKKVETGDTIYTDDNRPWKVLEAGIYERMGSQQQILKVEPITA